MAASEWQPMETWRDDGAVILRPHRIWGAMDVRYIASGVKSLNGTVYHWLNGDYTTAWPDDALLPFWMPIPEPPQS